MNERGQAILEYLICNGWALIVIAIVVWIVFFIVNTPYELSDKQIAAENFCKAWAEENGFTHLGSRYGNYFFEGRQVRCEYSSNADVFGGGISPGTTRFKYFNILEEDLLKWISKEENDICDCNCSILLEGK